MNCDLDCTRDRAQRPITTHTMRLITLGLLLAIQIANADTLFVPTSTPATIDSNDPQAVELGVNFQPLVNGAVTGVRFFKSTSNTGTHVGSLWTTAGKLLARATFSNETASGWQQMNFSAPVAVTAHTTYIISYHTTVGHYSGDNHFFDSAVTNAGGTLTAL